jgi:cation transport regulator ChaC
MASEMEDGFWIFGYGLVLHHENHHLSEMLIKDRSLIWKPPPHYGMLSPYPAWEEYIDDLQTSGSQGT